MKQDRVSKNTQRLTKSIGGALVKRETYIVRRTLLSHCAGSSTESVSITSSRLNTSSRTNSPILCSSAISEVAPRIFYYLSEAGPTIASVLCFLNVLASCTYCNVVSQNKRHE